MTGAAVTVKPSGGPLGAEVTGLDLAVPAPAPIVDGLISAFHRHLVLLFRGQRLTADTLIAFGRQFGRLHATGGVAYGAKPAGTPPEIEILSNLPEDAVPEGARPADEATWHVEGDRPQPADGAAGDGGASP